MMLLVQIVSWLGALLVILIVLVSLLAIAFGICVGFQVLIERHQEKRQPMATDMTPDELRMRRNIKDALYKECLRRAETMDFARKLK